MFCSVIKHIVDKVHVARGCIGCNQASFKRKSGNMVRKKRKKKTLRTDVVIHWDVHRVPILTCL